MPESNAEVERTADEQFDYEMNQIEIMFPNAKFTISMPLEDLDKVITDQPHRMIKHTYNCYCYDECPRNAELYYISGESLTILFILQKLIAQELVLDCNHHSL